MKMIKRTISIPKPDDATTRGIRLAPQMLASGVCLMVTVKYV